VTNEDGRKFAVVIGNDRGPSTYIGVRPDGNSHRVHADRSGKIPRLRRRKTNMLARLHRIMTGVEAEAAKKEIGVESGSER